MDFSIMPSLKHRALVKIAVTLFNHDDVRILISKCLYIKYSSVQSSIELAKKELKIVENEVLKYVLKLPLPKLLKNELLNFVEAVGWQLLKWRQCYQFFKDSYKKNYTKFHWTPQGTIDRKQASELYVNDESLPVKYRYLIACWECLEDYIGTLWEQLKRCISLSESRKLDLPLTSFWSHYMEGKLHLLSGTIRTHCRNYNISPCFSLYEYMFHYSVTVANLAATRYFFQKLTPEQKEKLLLPSAMFSVEKHYSTELHANFTWNIFDGECYADNSAFLISNLNKEQQKEMYRKYPHCILKCFLIWPRQTSFMELAKSMFCCSTRTFSDFTPVVHSYFQVQYYRGHEVEYVIPDVLNFMTEVQYFRRPEVEYFTPEVQNFAPEVQYYRVLKMIASKILSDSTDYSYRKLFAEFWHESHCTYKKYVIDNYASDPKLSAVFKVEDTVNIRIVWTDAIISRKRKTFCD